MLHDNLYTAALSGFLVGFILLTKKADLLRERHRTGFVLKDILKLGAHVLPQSLQTGHKAPWLFIKEKPVPVSHSTDQTYSKDTLQSKFPEWERERRAAYTWKTQIVATHSLLFILLPGPYWVCTEDCFCQWTSTELRSLKYSYSPT